MLVRTFIGKNVPTCSKMKETYLTSQSLSLQLFATCCCFLNWSTKKRLRTSVMWRLLGASENTVSARKINFGVIEVMCFHNNLQETFIDVCTNMISLGCLLRKESELTETINSLLSFCYRLSFSAFVNLSESRKRSKSFCANACWRLWVSAH